MHAFECLKGLIFPILASAFITPSVALETSTSNVDLTTPQVDQLSAQNKSKNTFDKSDVKQPSSWAEHATVSYEMWRQGNIFQAMSEGEKATELNPVSTVSLINLALMKQNSNSYEEAISLYGRAAKLEPQNWVAPLGIARCYILSGDLARGRKALRSMSEQNRASFDWYYMAAKTWLEISDLTMAEKCATKAVDVVSGAQQQASAENLLFLVFLRGGKFGKAKSLQDSVFGRNQPRDPELYVRAASDLLPVKYTDGGKGMLDCAMKNFNTSRDAESLFKLGRIFEIKSADIKCDAASRASWLESAQIIYRRAVALNPKSAEYHFALAGIYAGEKLWTNTAEELEKALAIDRFDILAPFLIAKIQNSGKADQKRSIPLNLSLIQFKIEGLTCACKLSKIQTGLRKFPNVVFISTPPKKPFMGLMLVDQSVLPVSEILSKCKESAFAPDPNSKDPVPKVNLEIISEKPVETADMALTIAEDIRFGQLLDFQQTFSEYTNRFKEIYPIMPMSDASATATAPSWSAPL